VLSTIPRDFFATIVDVALESLAVFRAQNLVRKMTVELFSKLRVIFV
jgi:hypothetical protein